MTADDDIAVPDKLIIDLTSVGDSEQLQTLLRRELQFPAWTGRNWDAFNDVINRMIELPKEITFVGWAQFAKLLPDDARIMRSILDDYASRYLGRPGWEANFRYLE